MANIQRSQDGALWNHRKPLAQTKMLRDSHAKGRVRPELLVPLHSRFWCWWCWCVPRNSQKTWQRHATTWFKPVNLARIGSRCLNSKQTATSDQRIPTPSVCPEDFSASTWCETWSCSKSSSISYATYQHTTFWLRLRRLLSSAAGDGGKAPLVVSSTVPGEPNLKGLKSRNMFLLPIGGFKDCPVKGMIPGGKGNWEPTAVMPAQQESSSNRYSEGLSLVFWKK